MKSSLYFGEVRHHRRSPKKHDLSYKLFMPHLFLDELDEALELVLHVYLDLLES